MPSKPPQSSPRVGPAHVVIVDDEPDMLDLLGELVRAGIPDARVSLATSPFKALELIARDNADLVITDYRMPGLDGLEFAKQVRGVDPEMPIVLMTAFSDDGLRTEAFMSRVNVFLKKPVDPVELLAEVGRLVRNRRGPPSRVASTGADSP